tara:strand:- start:3533 stop:3730 length:198 start_codon:yes stop_codon:yes gene_type:complete
MINIKQKAKNKIYSNILHLEVKVNQSFKKRHNSLYNSTYEQTVLAILYNINELKVWRKLKKLSEL